MPSKRRVAKVYESGNKLEVLGYDKKSKSFKVRDSKSGNICNIVDTFAEMFTMWVGRVLITAENELWAKIAAQTATGFASSIIMSPAEAGIEKVVNRKDTPDDRPGVQIQIYHRARADLKNQMVLRIGQCVMTCPTTAAFDALPEAKRRLRVGRSLRLFGDGFQKKDSLADRSIWRIPVMEGEFIVEDKFGTMKAIAGGNLIITAKNRGSGLEAAEKAVNAIRKSAKNVILPFPGGICRAGSKAGSLNYKLKASTSHIFCPKLKDLVADSQVPEKAQSVYEIVINGLDINSVTNAMREGILASVEIPNLVTITAGNYDGRLGSHHAYLKEVLSLNKK